MTHSFSLSSSVESLFERWPKTVQLFIRHQMACPGCYMAEFESLEGALQIYQVRQTSFLDDLQRIIKDYEIIENHGNYQEP